MATESEVVYADSLIKISDNGILFKSYGLLGGDRFVLMDDIENITINKPTIWNGKWRWQGTGDFKTWFPADYTRNKRDFIFRAQVSHKWWRIGFTVEDSEKVVQALQEKGFLKDIDLPLEESSRLDNSEKASLRDKNKRTKAIFWLIVILSGVILPLFLILYFFLLN